MFILIRLHRGFRIFTKTEEYVPVTSQSKPQIKLLDEDALNF